MPANLENSAVAVGLLSLHSNPKESSNYHTIALISNVSKIMLKILQARFQQYMNWELPNVFKLDLGKAEEPEKCWIIEKAREFQKKKTFYFHLIEYIKAFDCVDHNKLWNILKEMRIPDHLIGFWETCVQYKKQQLE